MRPCRDHRSFALEVSLRGLASQTKIADEKAQGEQSEHALVGDALIKAGPEAEIGLSPFGKRRKPETADGHSEIVAFRCRPSRRHRIRPDTQRKLFDREAPVIGLQPWNRLRDRAGEP